MRSARQDLLQDIESYLCGEVPSPLAMKRAPKIEGWRVQVRRRGKEFILTVVGDAFGHHEILDGEPISVGAVVWFDRHLRWIRTHQRLYALGEPAEVPKE